MAKRVVYCYETKQEFESTTAAAKWCGFRDSESIRVTLNKPDRTSFGYHWCTSLNVFDGVELTKKNEKSIYCYETKEKYISKVEAEKAKGISTIPICVVNNPNKTSGGYHWCTSLDVFDGVKLTEYDHCRRFIFCYETKKRFSSIKDASNYIGIPIPSSVIDKSDKTIGGYHWCSDLSIFDGKELISFNKKKIYCYETKQEFESLTQAVKEYNLPSIGNISSALDNPLMTTGGYHWCTDLSIFDDVEIKYPRKPTRVYCYETKEEFTSCTDAGKFKLGSSELGSNISRAVNDPCQTAGGYHWCTDLSIFDEVELLYANSGSSGKERQVLDFVKTLSDSVIENSRKIISPLELDIYLPDHNFAIEFNGTYWHSEACGKDKDYHIDKTNMCKEKSISLLHIFQHQWESKSEIFKSVIANKLSKSEKIYARKCKVVELKDCKEFLESNHLQGNCSSSIKLGLKYNDELVSVMTFGKSRFNKNFQYELIRFCNKLNTSVIGGASKLLKYFEKNYKPESIISYANLQWSKGTLYAKLGFINIGISKPNYCWVKRQIALSRYQCQKHKLASLLGDKFDPELSEKDNMEKAGYSRLFDCGNITFVKYFE